MSGPDLLELTISMFAGALLIVACIVYVNRRGKIG